MKILIAEDDPVSRRLLEARLLKWGYEVVVAQDGSEAWRVLQEADTPRLAILDWMMPGMDGVEISRKVRERIKEPYIYIILLTALHREEDLVAGMEAGADSYITKPFRPNELEVRLLAGRRIIELQEQLHQKHLETSVLYRISSVVSRSIHMDKLLSEVLNTISELKVFRMDRGAIFIVEGDRMKIAAQLGHSATFVDMHKNMKVGDCLCGAAAQKGELIISPNSSKDSRHSMSDPYSVPHGHVIVPLKTKERVEGVLDLYVPLHTAIDEERVELLHSIGNQLGIAVENARLYEETKALSLRDSLTGLWNHGEILRILRQELARAGREEGCVTVIMADLDHFKKVNDTYGHMAGDAVLRTTAQRMLSVLRPYDAVGRYGGEEFLLILPGCDKQYIANTAERFRARIGGENMDTPNGSIKVTISLGVAMSSRGRRADVNSLVQAADSALYRAKEKGRDRVEIASGEETT